MALDGALALEEAQENGPDNGIEVTPNVGPSKPSAAIVKANPEGQGSEGSEGVPDVLVMRCSVCSAAVGNAQAYYINFKAWSPPFSFNTVVFSRTT